MKNFAAGRNENGAQLTRTATRRSGQQALGSMSVPSLPVLAHHAVTIASHHPVTIAFHHAWPMLVVVPVPAQLMAVGGEGFTARCSRPSAFGIDVASAAG